MGSPTSSRDCSDGSQLQAPAALSLCKVRHIVSLQCGRARKQRGSGAIFPFRWCGMVRVLTAAQQLLHLFTLPGPTHMHA
jgi:hypothetical protein